MFKASAPGSLMLLGEYAVLHRHHALVSAIDKRIQVTLIPRDDKKIIIDSALGHYETSLSHLESVAPFQFVLAVFHSLKKNLRYGCHLTVETEFSDTVGFASSAAVTAATLGVLMQWLKLPFSKIELIKWARRIIRRVQGAGSGADIAACVLGGIVFYRAEPLFAQQFQNTYPLTVIYSGHKTATPVAIKHIQKKFAEFPDIFSCLMKTINACTLQGVAALQLNDWQKLGEVMNVQQGLMDALGVNTPALNQLIELVRREPRILGAKISGSGLGDCIVALGECLLNVSSVKGAQQLNVNMTMEGLRCEKI